MTGEELTKGYERFFSADEGKEMLDVLGSLIIDQHRKAENDPELSRDYTQRAKGIRLVVDHINSVRGGVKK